MKAALVGKKVWVVQYDDEDSSVYGIVHSIEDGFIALCIEGDDQEDPALFVNLQNVKEIEKFHEQEEGYGKLMLLRSSRDEILPN